MKFLSFISNLENRKFIFIIIIFLSVFVFRFPTLFTNFYDTDELYKIIHIDEIFAEKMSCSDFSISDQGVFYYIFQPSYSFSPESGYIFVHIITILIIFFTSFFIYLIGSKLYDFTTGAVASLFYSILISSFCLEYLATSGEIIFNLAITAGLFFLIVFLSIRRVPKPVSKDNDEIDYVIPCQFSKQMALFSYYNYRIKKCSTIIIIVIMSIGAAITDFQGVFFFFFLIYFLFIYYPYYENRFAIRYFLPLTAIIVLLLMLFLFNLYSRGYYNSNILIIPKGKIFFDCLQEYNLFSFFPGYIYQLGLLVIFHFVLWIPVCVYFYSFIKNRFMANTGGESAIALIFVFAFLVMFCNAIHQNFQNLQATYPSLCVLSSIVLMKLKTGSMLFIKNRIAYFLFIPSIFFLIWNIMGLIFR